MRRESATQEFKREYTEEIKKSVIAFANTEGGELLVGVGDDCESMRSLAQDLTFEGARAFFEEEGIKFGPEQKRTLGLVGEDGAYSNLALLLSDQCVHTVKAAVFEGSAKRVFKDRAEFSGSLLKQLGEVYAYLDRFNRTRAEVSGLKRVEIRDYPPEALREALLNAIVHREYAYGADTLVSIFDDRVEFVSLGGLPKGIGCGDMMLGVSVLRNRRLANVFYRLRLIEAFGTGVPRIMECYGESEMKPKFEVSDNAFKITLPNINFRKDEISGEPVPADAERRVLNFVAERGVVSRKEIENALGLSRSATVRLLGTLAGRGLIVKRGDGKNRTYSASSRASAPR